MNDPEPLAVEPVMTENSAEVAMPAEPAAVPGEPGEWHWTLLRMAGAISDEVISECRDWLADGDQVEVAATLSVVAAATRIPVLERDADLIYEELAAAGQSTDVVAELNEFDDDAELPLAPWLFTPILVDDPDHPDVPALLDLSSDPAEAASLDSVDQAAVEAARSEPEISAVWRAWRYPTGGLAWPLPRRIFVVTTQPGLADDELPALTGRLHRAVQDAGENAPQVELCPAGLLPIYQQAARANAALLWAQEPALVLEFARIFDQVDAEHGPQFDPDRARIDNVNERLRLLDYLQGAVAVLPTTATMVDILDPEHRDVVPLSFRTDGRWIWTDTVSYYLAHYGLAPDGDLLAHVRAAGSLPPSLSEVGLHRVLAFMERSSHDEPVWAVPDA